MTPSSDLQEKLRRYLLGQLDKQIREDIERNLLTDDNAFEELLILEGEITDDFVAGRLNPTDQTAFERHFLAAPERHQELTFARALKRHVATVSPQKENPVTWWPAFLSRHPLPWLATCAAVILAAVVGAVWLRSQRTPQTFATLTLTAGQATRSDGNEIPRLKLPLRESSLKIVMVLSESAPAATTYRAQVHAESGSTLSIEASPQNDQSVSIIIPASKLEIGRYAIKLFARAPDSTEQPVSGNYVFMLD